MRGCYEEVRETLEEAISKLNNKNIRINKDPPWIIVSLRSQPKAYLYVNCNKEILKVFLCLNKEKTPDCILVYDTKSEVNKEVLSNRLKILLKVATNSNYASTLGEDLGRILEDSIHEILLEFSKKHKNVKVSREEKWKDRDGDEHKLDFIIYVNNKPVVVLESKFLRYKKHMRDKGSRVIDSLTEIRKRYPSIAMAIAILVGNWTKGSLKAMDHKKIKTITLPLEKFSEIFKKFKIEINWDEKDRVTPFLSLLKLKMILNKEEFSDVVLLDNISYTSDPLTNIKEDIKKQISKPLFKLLDEAINPDNEKIEKINIDIYTNIGRIISLDTQNINEARMFLDCIADTKNISSLIDKITKQKLKTQQEKIDKYLK
ncbi:hypothetical protein [Thermococcus gammatolerans]|uniref:Uncharacterized protein n=1 Tax=Thermococcus gammatolerans (strain DSM 15229 / JCM 11827 / EJ3) TaxID=593117 RepID=C5A347_THEGJ|nr:hypothetical protein [Thermococcus gammatolerans]ACS32659.1 Hypothetical protein TGAM_0157 [Thermococcus gammatolerans EJ3]